MTPTKLASIGLLDVLLRPYYGLRWLARMNGVGRLCQQQTIEPHHNHTAMSSAAACTTHPTQAEDLDKELYSEAQSGNVLRIEALLTQPGPKPDVNRYDKSVSSH